MTWRSKPRALLELVFRLFPEPSVVSFQQSANTLRRGVVIKDCAIGWFASLCSLADSDQWGPYWETL